MENIRQAIERAKVSRPTSAEAQGSTAASFAVARRPDLIAPTTPRQYAGRKLRLTPHTWNRRVIAHDIADPRSKSFDMLLLQF